jgi:hypothetical protein
MLDCSQPGDFLRLSYRYIDSFNNEIILEENTLKEVLIDDLSEFNKWEEKIIENFEIENESDTELQVLLTF